MTLSFFKREAENKIPPFDGASFDGLSKGASELCVDTLSFLASIPFLPNVGMTCGNKPV